MKCPKLKHSRAKHGMQNYCFIVKYANLWRSCRRFNENETQRNWKNYDPWQDCWDSEVKATIICTFADAMIPFSPSPPNAMLISTEVSLLNMLHLHKSTNIDFFWEGGGGERGRAFSSFKSTPRISPENEGWSVCLNRFCRGLSVETIWPEIHVNTCKANQLMNMSFGLVFVHERMRGQNHARDWKE